MSRRKTSQDLEQEWSLWPKDWYSIYQWNSLKVQTYTEKVSSLILHDFDRIVINYEHLRKDDFKIKDHHGQCKLGTPISQITEKRLLRAMYNLHTVNLLGIIKDYEVPLKSIQSVHHGDIDLLVRDEDEHKIRLIEAKKPGSSESLLKGVLQVYTYTKLVSSVRDRFLRSYDIQKDVKLSPVVLTFDSAASGKQLLNIGAYPEMKALLKKLNQDLLDDGIGPIEFYSSNLSDEEAKGCLREESYKDKSYKIYFKKSDFDLRLTQHSV